MKQPAKRILSRLRLVKLITAHIEHTIQTRAVVFKSDLRAEL